LIREDRDILADLGLQEELFSLLFSYEMPWLRLGLEIVFGEIISVHSSSSPKNGTTVYPCKSNCPKWKSAIKTFVLERMLTNVDLVAQYSKQQLLCVSHEKKLKEELRQHMIKKFLSLVLLLDLSKKNSILLLPTLYVREAPVKSSKEIILTFCRCIMRGEGDVIRHLSLLGYTVSFAQSFIDEFDYTVKNLAVDLRDGVRLARLMELITHSKDLSDQLRVPAGSRLQKLHNVGLVLKKLYDEDVVKFDGNASINSVPASCDQVQESKDIVDGNRDRTLFLLWKMLYSFELKMLVDSSKVLGEAAIISGSEGWRYTYMHMHIYIYIYAYI
jgi:abnormal spindle-like microcephaly-associated protein